MELVSKWYHEWRYWQPSYNLSDGGTGASRTQTISAGFSSNSQEYWITDAVWDSCCHWNCITRPRDECSSSENWAVEFSSLMIFRPIKFYASLLFDVRFVISSLKIFQGGGKAYIGLYLKFWYRVVVSFCVLCTFNAMVHHNFHHFVAILCDC